MALQIESQHKAFSATWRWKPSANRHGRVRIQADWNNFKGVKSSSKSTSSNTKRKCWWSWSRSTCEHCVHLCSRVLTCFTLPLNNPRDWVCNACIVCIVCVCKYAESSHERFKACTDYLSVPVSSCPLDGWDGAPMRCERPVWYSIGNASHCGSEFVTGTWRWAVADRWVAIAMEGRDPCLMNRDDSWIGNDTVQV